MGYQRNSHFYGSVGPQECIFMAPLALFNEGVRAQFFHLVEAPTMRLQNAKHCSVGPLECIYMALFEITHF